MSRDLHRNKNNEEEEYKIAQEAITLALKLNDTLLYARALDNMGLLFRYHEWYAQSLPFHTKAYDLIKNRDVEPIFKMIFANNAGLSARYDQQYDLSVSYYLEALKIAQQEGDLRNIGISSNGLGNSLSQIPGREDEARDYFIQAIRTQREMNNSLGVAMNLLSISDYYRNHKNYDTALHYLDTLYSVNVDRQDTFGLALTNEAYGSLYLSRDSTVTAATYFQTSLRQFQRLNNKTKEAEVLHDLGKLNLKSSDPDNAEEYFLKSLYLADNIRNKALVSQNAFAISTIMEQRQDYASALRYFQMGKSYDDSIALSEQRLKIATLTNQFKLDQQKTEINKLQQENIVNKQKIHFQRVLFSVFAGAFLLILFLSILQYRSEKVKRKALRMLHSKQQELLKTQYEKGIAQAEMMAARAQLNPHFLFNCLNGLRLLILKKDFKSADQYLIILSRFLRMVLELPKSETITLNEEIRLIKYYIALEENRFDNGFSFELDTLTDEEMEVVEIPPLLLQPFVENAIWHGLLPSQNTRKLLLIRITREGTHVKISIEDNGVGRRQNGTPLLHPEQNKRKSLGTKITSERIDHFNKTYPCKIKFDIIDKTGNAGERLGTTVLLTIQNCLDPVFADR